jgi:hypothetical protein
MLTKSKKFCDGSWVSSWVVLVCAVPLRWERMVDRRGRRVGSSSSGGRGTPGASRGGSLASISKKSIVPSSSSVDCSAVDDIVGGRGDMGNSMRLTSARI